MKKAIIFISAIISVIPAAVFAEAGASSGAGVDSSLDQGQEKFKSGDYTGASAIFSSAVKTLPNYPRAAILNVNALFASGRFDDAAAELQRALTLGGTLDSEIMEIKNSWRDYPLLRKRVIEVGSLAESSKKPAIINLYGFYYGIAGYREFASAVFNTIPSNTPEYADSASLLRCRYPSMPWVDLPSPVSTRHDGPEAIGKEPLPPEGVSRRLSVGFGLGGTFLTGQIQNSTNTQLTAWGGARVYIGWLATEQLELDVNFTWQYMQGNMNVPNVGWSQNIGMNLYTIGADFVYHFLRKSRKSGFDPSIRAGFSFLDLATDSWYYYYYYPGVTAALGYGPSVGVSFDYLFRSLPTDFVVGLDIFYQVIVMTNDYGNVDGGALSLQAKFNFIF